MGCTAGGGGGTGSGRPGEQAVQRVSALAIDGHVAAVGHEAPEDDVPVQVLLPLRCPARRCRRQRHEAGPVEGQQFVDDREARPVDSSIWSVPALVNAAVDGRAGGGGGGGRRRVGNPRPSALRMVRWLLIVVLRGRCWPR